MVAYCQNFQVKRSLANDKVIELSMQNIDDAIISNLITHKFK